MPLPPGEEEETITEENAQPKLQFSYVECLIFTFHQLAKKVTVVWKANVCIYMYMYVIYTNSSLYEVNVTGISRLGYWCALAEKCYGFKELVV